MQRHVSMSCTIDRCSSEGRVSKTAISNVSRVFNHIFQSARQRAHSVKYVTVSERLYERRCRRRRGWSVVKGRSDIYTRPLPLVHSVGCYMVSWWNTETLNIHTLLFLPFLSRFLSFYLPFYLSQPFCSRLVRSLFFPLSSPSCFISFHSALSHRPVYLHSSSLFPLSSARIPPFLRLVSHSFLQLDEDNVRVTFAFSETSSFSTRTIVWQPIAILSPSCFAKRTRPAWMEFYAGCARKNVTAPGMNLDYGNAR